MNGSYTISYTISYVRHTISYVKILFSPIVCTTSYTMSYTTSYVFYTTSYVPRTTYDIAKKRTISYVFDLFLPVVCATSYTTSYVFYRCRIRHRTFFHASSVLYDIVREVTMSIVTSTKTYDIVLRRRRQYRSMRYSIRYAPNLRYSIRYALKFACLE